MDIESIERKEVSRWKVRVDENQGLMAIGVMELPFAPIEGLARKLATRAWFVNSAGEVVRTGPSTIDGNHEWVEKDNMTWMNPDTKVWEEGSDVNPDYRKPGCDMIVDPQSGETAWLESDRLRQEALGYQSEDMLHTMTENLALQLIVELGPELVSVGAQRFLKIDARRRGPCKENGWKEETFEACLNRSIDDGYWDTVTEELPLPDLSGLGYRNYTGRREQLMQEVQELLTADALQIAAEAGIPEDYCYPVRELCKVERLAKNDIFKFGPQWFWELLTDGEPSEVRLEFNRRDGTLHVRVDNRPESFLFRNVPAHAQPFVNLCVVGDSVTLLQE